MPLFQIIKSFKTHVGKIAREEHGHHVLLALFDAVDDTVSVRKSVLNVCAVWYSCAYTTR